MQSGCYSGVEASDLDGNLSFSPGEFVQRQQSLPNVGSVHYPVSSLTKSPQATLIPNCKDISLQVSSRGASRIEYSTSYTNLKTGVATKTGNAMHSKRLSQSFIANSNGSHKNRPINISQLRQQSLPASLTTSKSVSQKGKQGNSYKKMMSGPSLTSIHHRREQRQRRQQAPIPSKLSPQQEPLLKKRCGANPSQKFSSNGGSSQRKLSLASSPLHAGIRRCSSNSNGMGCSGEIEIAQVQLLPKVDDSSRKTAGCEEFDAASLFPNLKSCRQYRECKDAKFQLKLQRRSIEVQLPTTSTKVAGDSRKLKISSPNAAKKKHHFHKSEEAKLKRRKSLNHGSSVKTKKSSITRSKQTSSLSPASEDGKLLYITKRRYVCLHFTF